MSISHVPLVGSLAAILFCWMWRTTKILDSHYWRSKSNCAPFLTMALAMACCATCPPHKNTRHCCEGYHRLKSVLIISDRPSDMHQSQCFSAQSTSLPGQASVPLAKDHIYSKFAAASVRISSQ